MFFPAHHWAINYLQQPYHYYKTQDHLSTSYFKNINSNNCFIISILYLLIPIKLNYSHWSMQPPLISLKLVYIHPINHYLILKYIEYFKLVSSMIKGCVNSKNWMEGSEKDHSHFLNLYSNSLYWHVVYHIVEILNSNLC